MKRSFVQCAELLLETDADPASPGGAATLRLCGSWDHAGPCRWPHRTSANWEGARGKIRVVFTAREEEELEVRRLIHSALTHGQCVGPDGRRSRWTVTAHSGGTLNDEEATVSAPWEAAE
jgi:hypothetical protein